MQKIQTTEEKERKTARNRRIISIFLLSLLVISSLGFAFIYYQDSSAVQDSTDQQESANGRWNLKIGEETISFANSPESVADIPINLNITAQDYLNSSVYLVSDSDAISEEIRTTLGKYINLKSACLGRCEENLPEKNCTDNLIVWNNSESTRVYQQENCVFIEGDIRAADAFLFKIMGVSSQ